MILPSRDSATRFLIIRRDNIGDLVCTTPAVHALRRQFPRARIALLVNSYNAEVVARNPDVDEVYVYTKFKHRPENQPLGRYLWERLRTFLRLRRARFDYAIIAGSAEAAIHRTARLARFFGARHVVAFVDSAGQAIQGVDLPVARPNQSLHEVEHAFRLVSLFGVEEPPSPVRIYPDSTQVERTRAALSRQQESTSPLIAVHISARKPSNRWPAARFLELIEQLHSSYGAEFVLLWAPGSNDDPKHPGDDAKAEEILSAAKNLPVTPWPTHELSALISALACSDAMICSDGGAMHLAAALNKPILCFFGDSDASHWRPWGVSHVVLQPPSRQASDISVADALAAFAKVMPAPARQS